MVSWKRIPVYVLAVAVLTGDIRQRTQDIQDLHSPWRTILRGRRFLTLRRPGIPLCRELELRGIQLAGQLYQHIWLHLVGLLLRRVLPFLSRRPSPRHREAVRKPPTTMGRIHRHGRLHVPNAHQRLHGILPIRMVRQQLFHGIHRHPSIPCFVFWPPNRLLAGSVGVETGRRGHADRVAGDPRSRGTSTSSEDIEGEIECPGRLALR